MTSANVTHFELYAPEIKDFDCSLRMIATESQHALCKDRISGVLEQWEKDYPDALLALRWPDENEVDQYLTFDMTDDYPEDLGTEHYIEEERDMCTLRVYMTRRREHRIRYQESLIESLRESLRKYTGDGRIDDYNLLHAFRTYKNDAKATAEDIGHGVTARVNANGGNFTSDFLLPCRNAKEVEMALEAISYFYRTGRVPQYDEAYPEEG